LKEQEQAIAEKFSYGPVAQAASLLYRRLLTCVGGDWNRGTRGIHTPAGWQPAKQQTRLAALQIRTTAPGSAFAVS
jgi:hypothetical protein